MGLPQFLCIGAQKTGTSWLFEHLVRHPGVWMPPIKELHYFDHLFVERNRRWTLSHLQSGARTAINWHVKKYPQADLQYIKYITQLATEDVFTEQWYRFAFDRPVARGRICGDITPEYSTIPEVGIDYVRRLLGAVKIIYIIREPVSRALSQLRMSAMRQGLEKADETTWLKLASERDIENRGAYSVYVPRWRRAFSAEDTLFIAYQRIAREPLTVLRDVEAFLGLDEHAFTGLDTKIHATAPITIPASARQIIEQRVGPERDFVEREFGREFSALT